MQIESGRDLERAVVRVGEALGLEAETQVPLGQRIWGRNRRIDVVLTRPDTGVMLGVECKFQQVSGSTEEKILATIADIDAWPIRGLVVVHGDGFSPDFKAFVRSSGKAIEFAELDTWMRFYFGLPRERVVEAELALNGGD